MSLVIVGTVAFDTIETPFGKADMVVGGAALYGSIAASHYTDDVQLVSVIGEDFPQDELDYMAGRGINQEGLQLKKGEKSFYWSGRYHDNMNKRDTLVTDLNVLETFDPVLPESYKESKYVMLGNLQPEVQMRVIEQMNKRPKLIIMDTMNFWMDIAMDSLKKTIAKIDVLTINDEEARQLSGEYSLVKAAAKILDMGPTYLVIKKGEHGALLFDKNNVFSAPALPLAEVYDPTGAGDTFAGAFAGYIAQTDDISFENLKRAIIHGSAMASFSVEKFSNQRLKELTTEELDARLQKFVDLTTFDLALAEVA
ncbi:MAG: PfkB family carbohydrate kinase [Saprospiraceae bacterium]